MIRLYGILTCCTGLLAAFFFFPSSGGCSDFWTCLLYMGCGLILCTLGTGIVLRCDTARKFMILFSFLFGAFFVYQTVWFLKNDPTGQGLVGIMLLAPIFLVCCLGLVLLLSPSIGREFEHKPSLIDGG